MKMTEFNSCQMGGSFHASLRQIPRAAQNAKASGFTLLDLLVVIVVLAVLLVLELPALAAGKSQSKIAMCASHVRQLVLSCQIYANENNNLLPGAASVGNWLWDTSTSITDALLKSGVQTNTFYCPGTSPRFTDTLNWSGAGSLWSFGAPTFHVIGYSLALNQAQLIATNQNRTMLPERFVSGGKAPPMNIATGTSDRVLVADATISTANAQPGYTSPGNNYIDILGGFPVHHLSPHLKGNVPAGGNVGFKDGHVEWRNFNLMIPRTGSGAGIPFFWW